MSTDRELTPWFDAFHEPPTRQGWYDFRGYLIDSGSRMYWNGHHWGFWIGPGRRNWTHLAEVPTDKWRGLVRAAASIGEGA